MPRRTHQSKRKKEESPQRDSESSEGFASGVIISPSSRRTPAPRRVGWASAHHDKPRPRVRPCRPHPKEVAAKRCQNSGALLSAEIDPTTTAGPFHGTLDAQVAPTNGPACPSGYFGFKYVRYVPTFLYFGNDVIAYSVSDGQYTSQHVFEPTPDGGRIVLQRKEADSAGEAVIREHMHTIAQAFAAGTRPVAPQGRRPDGRSYRC